MQTYLFPIAEEKIASCLPRVEICFYGRLCERAQVMFGSNISLDYLLPQPQQHTVATDIFRAKIRNYTRQQRDWLRAQHADAVRFGLGEIQTKIQELDSLTEKDVGGLATRIKRRKHATVEDMYRLSHAFLQGVDNISTFANTPGALQIIVKELTGNDAARRVGAAECICNLSLGVAPVCDKIVSIAGSYLVTYLDSTEERLKRTALWSLANVLATSLAGGGGKCAETLVHMELVPKLWTLYAADSGEFPEDYREDAGLCLQLICCQAKRLLRQSDETFLQQNFHKKHPACPGAQYHLQIVFHSSAVRSNCVLGEQQVGYLINFALRNLSENADFVATPVLYAVRILANLLATQTQCLSMLLHQISTVFQTNLGLVLNQLFAHNDEALTRETLWLLNNLLQQLDTNTQNNLLRRLQVGRSDVARAAEHAALLSMNF